MHDKNSGEDYINRIFGNEVKEGDEVILHLSEAPEAVKEQFRNVLERVDKDRKLMEELERLQNMAQKSTQCTIAQIRLFWEAVEKAVGVEKTPDGFSRTIKKVEGAFVVVEGLCECIACRAKRGDDVSSEEAANFLRNLLRFKPGFGG
jgi:hypothetical protein